MTERDDRPMDEATVDELLASDAVWAEPPPELEDETVAAIQRHRDVDVHRRPLRRWRIATAVSGIVAAAATVVAVVALTAEPPTRQFDQLDELAATGLAPSATATIEVTETASGTRLILFVDGLAPAAEDEVYEGWMLDGDRAVSAGTFHVREGTDPIWLWSGVPPTTFDQFVVTRHPIDQPVPPSGPDDPSVVLRGVLGP